MHDFHPVPVPISVLDEGHLRAAITQLSPSAARRQDTILLGLQTGLNFFTRFSSN